MHGWVKLVGIMVALSVASAFAADRPWVYVAMSDLNNVRIADLLSQFLAEKKLD